MNFLFLIKTATFIYFLIVEFYEMCSLGMVEWWMGDGNGWMIVWWKRIEDRDDGDREGNRVLELRNSDWDSNWMIERIEKKKLVMDRRTMTERVSC